MTDDFKSDPQLRRKAARIRFREMGTTWTGKIAVKLQDLCLVLTDKEKEVVRDHIAALLMEVFDGGASLEPNTMQYAAAAAGREEITDADMLMLAARIQIAEKVAGRQLTTQESKREIMGMVEGMKGRALEADPSSS